MKKCLSFVLLCAMILGLGQPATAMPLQNMLPDEEQRLQTLEEIAYLDIAEASPVMQEQILEARNAVAFTKEWVADGIEGWVEDVRTGEIIRYLPAFSEVFPGWDLPISDASAVRLDAIDIPEASSNSSLQASSDWVSFTPVDHYLEAPVEGQNTAPFALLRNMNRYTKMKAYATRLTSSKTCNIGFSNASNMQSIGSARDLTLYQAFTVNVFGIGSVHVRASTYSTPGWATFAFEGLPVNYSLVSQDADADRPASAGEWVADGREGYVEDVLTGEIIRRIPSYSEVFPGQNPPEPDMSELHLDSIFVYDAATAQSKMMYDVTLPLLDGDGWTF